MEYYVTMTDTFFSGWGKAKGRTNKLVIICDTYEQAQIVYENAKRRKEQKYVNIRSTKPYYNSSTNYVQFKNKRNMPNWFKPGYFK